MEKNDLSKMRNVVWHRLYFLLAAFNLVTIVASMILIHHLIDIHRGSLDRNDVWMRRAALYDELGQLGGRANSPGNDIFDSGNVALERARLTEANSVFLAKMALVVSELETIESLSVREELREQISRVNRSLSTMITETETIFSLFEIGNSTQASSRMAAMDRTFAVFSQNIDGLRTLVRTHQKHSLARESQRADDLATLKYIFGIVVLIMVLLIAWYGHVISKKIKGSELIISNQRELLLASEKLASIGTMAGGIAHEINNPMAIIHGSAVFLQRKVARDQLQTNDVINMTERIIKTTDRVLGIVKGLRTFARNGEQDPFESVKLDEILTEACALCELRFKSSGVRLMLEVPTKNAVVPCRQVQISQVLVNLLNNAFDAVCETEGAWVKVRSEVALGYVKIFVTDSGGGLSKDVVDQLFTPFFTTKGVGKGTGLGLPISLGILQSHNGKLEYNHGAKNTEFIMIVPLPNELLEVA
jgi:C4-dicarboxylate-specific signal transduction histidine kinase